MSVIASRWAWQQTTPSPAARLVLLALADHANDDGGSCHPGKGRLARMTGLNERTVDRALDALELAGLLTRTRTAGGWGKVETARTHYFLTIPEGGRETPPNRGRETPPRGGVRPPEPSVEPSVNNHHRRSKSLRVVPAPAAAVPGGGGGGIHHAAPAASTDLDRMLTEVTIRAAKADPGVRNPSHPRVLAQRLPAVREMFDTWCAGNPRVTGWYSPAVLAVPDAFAAAVEVAAAKIAGQQIPGPSCDTLDRTWERVVGTLAG